MIQAQAGDKNAYRDLLNAISPAILQFLNKRVGFLGMSEEVHQESLLAIHMQRHTYLLAQPFSPWMFAIVRYKMIDALRKNKKIQAREVADPDLIASVASPENSRQDFFASEQLQSALNRLKKDYREPLVLMKMDGLSVSEIANRLQISESNVKIRVHRAMIELKKQLKKMCFYEDN